jgi:hypothetical protein
MALILWFLEALLVLFLAVNIALILATACLGGLILGTVVLWSILEAHGLTPLHWTPLGVLQGIATIVALLPHICRYL